MGRISLNQNDKWHVEHDRQDIRGWPVLDAEGEKVGHVRDLIADTDSELVETIVLDSGKEYPARDVELGDDIVYLERTRAEGAEAEPVVKMYDKARVREREAESTTGFAAHEPAFREHYQSTYKEADKDYGHYHPAYRLGYDYGIDKEHRSRDWNDLEPEARRRYEERYGKGTWDKVRRAVQHAFERARASRTKERRTT